MNKSLLLLLCTLPLAGYGEEFQQVPVPGDVAGHVTEQPRPDAVDPAATPDDIAAEIEADEIYAEQLAPPANQSGPVESALGGAGAMIDSAVDGITPALEQGGEFFMDTAKGAAEKGGEVVDQITPALQQGAEVVEETAKGAVEKGAEVVEQVTPVLQEAGTAARLVTEDVLEKGAQAVDSLVGDGATPPPQSATPPVEQSPNPSGQQ